LHVGTGEGDAALHETIEVRGLDDRITERRNVSARWSSAKMKTMLGAGAADRETVTARSADRRRGKLIAPSKPPARGRQYDFRR
jgi:hypothetical protein